MQMKSMNKQEWKEHYEIWKLSNQTKKIYCYENGLSYGSFIYYSKQFEVATQAGSFKKLSPSSIPMCAEIVLRNGIRLYLPVSVLNQNILENLSNV